MQINLEIVAGDAQHSFLQTERLRGIELATKFGQRLAAIAALFDQLAGVIQIQAGDDSGQHFSTGGIDIDRGGIRQDADEWREFVDHAWVKSAQQSQLGQRNQTSIGGEIRFR